MSPGLLSALGWGRCRRSRLISISRQGNRVFDSLYDDELPPGRPALPAWWQAVVERADSAPADIVPGLLASTLEAAGVGVRVGGRASCLFRRPLGLPPPPPKKLSGAPARTAPTFEVSKLSPGERCRPCAEPARRRPADRDRAAAARRRRAAGDRDRRAGVRREPDLRQHPHSTATCSRPMSRRRSSIGSGSRCPRRCRGSRSAPRASVDAGGDRIARRRGWR